MKHLLRALALVAALVVGSQAQATILVACGEDISSCLMFNGVTFGNSVSDSYNASYSRGGYIFPKGTGVGVSAPFPTPQSVFWVTFTYYSSGALSVGSPMFQFKSPDGVVRLTGTIGSSNFKISKVNSVGTITDLATSSFGLTPSLTKIDIYINYSASGEFDVYENGIKLVGYTGNVLTDAATQINEVDLEGIAADNYSASVYSEVFAADRDTRSLHPMSCAPAAAGNTQAWTGSVSNINETAINDAAFNYDGTANQLSQWTMSCPSTIQPSWGIVDVQQFARVAVGTSGPQHFRVSAHVAGTDYDNGADIAGLLSFQNYGFDWGANSPSGGAWTPAELTTGFSNGVESTP